jgi:hypothetical protein
MRSNLLFPNLSIKKPEIKAEIIKIMAVIIINRAEY